MKDADIPLALLHGDSTAAGTHRGDAAPASHIRPRYTPQHNLLHKAAVLQGAKDASLRRKHGRTFCTARVLVMRAPIGIAVAALCVVVLILRSFS
jgi:hypothetical protein